MIRSVSLLPLPLLLGAGAPSTTALPDVIEGGRVAAQLSDWQTMAYFLMILIAIQALERLAAGWQARSTAKLQAAAMKELSAATSARGENIYANLMLVQSNQSDMKATLGDLRTLLNDIRALFAVEARK